MSMQNLAVETGLLGFCIACCRKGYLEVVRKGDRRKETALESSQQRSNLTKLSETELPLEEPWQDMRHLDVYDITDEQIGSVEELYLDREVRLASYLVVSAEGFWG
jgi:hypothetical protein